MDVYLIPVGPVGGALHELYCEDAGEPEESPADDQPTGRIGALYQKFKAALAQVEEERQSGVERGPEGLSRMERMKARAMCWIAEKIAEQRLLWRLRKVSEANLRHPDDITSAEAMAMARAMLQREAERHLRWTIVDGSLFAVSGVLALVPGPNLLAYYFGFRLVGHYLSRRGAKNALDCVVWNEIPSAELTRLRAALTLVGRQREQQVQQVAFELRLEKLPTFVERTSVHSA